jgi:hypothetical protein
MPRKSKPENQRPYDQDEDIEFGDTHPEDAWDDEDDEDTKVAILERVVDVLEDQGTEVNLSRRDDATRLLDKLAAVTRRRTDDHLDELRARLEAL